MTATPQRESKGIGRGELKDAKWELQRCGILLEGEREKERDAKEWGVEQGSHSDRGKEICEALGSAVHTLDMTDGREM